MGQRVLEKRLISFGENFQRSDDQAGKCPLLSNIQLVTFSLEDKEKVTWITVQNEGLTFYLLAGYRSTELLLSEFLHCLVL